jgi:pimeloyl-ACP methyl ester carboxylesterase
MQVILAHGLGRSRLSMLLLGRRLGLKGHSVEYFSYSALTETHEAILARLVARLRYWAAREKEVGLVGHSFGGLLFREGLALVPELKVRHLVMLGTPNRPPRLAARIYNKQPFRLLRGFCGELLANPSWYRSLPAIHVPYTLVAGTRGWRGALSPFDNELNDGIVAVSETIVHDTDQPVLLPAIHTFIMNSRAVHDLILQRFH